MKLGLAINAFEGTEHLYNIISEIRDLVDVVLVGLQKTSYTGIPIDPYDQQECKRLQNEGLIDKIVYINTDNKKFSREQETDKRNNMLNTLEEMHCDYALVIDSDEFYTHNSFKRAKDYIDKNKEIEVTYCRYMNYWRSPVGEKETYQYYLVYPFHDGQYVPFISKIKYRYKWQSKDFDKPSDPTRRYELPKVFKKDKDGKVIIKRIKKKNGEVTNIAEIDHYEVNPYVFEWKDLKMHHFSWIRNNIRKKMSNWSSKSYFTKPWEIIDRSAYQYENFKEGDKDAILLFNTPDNKVEIKKLDKQYIFPKVDIVSRHFICEKDVRIKVINIESCDNDYNILIDKLKIDNQNDHFIIIKNNLTLPEVLYDNIKYIMSIERDDSLIYVQDTIIDNHNILIPNGDFIAFSKSTRDKICDNMIAYPELNKKIDPITIIGYSINRYFNNLNIDYKNKLVKI